MHLAIRVSFAKNSLEPLEFTPEEAADLAGSKGDD